MRILTSLYLIGSILILSHCKEDELSPPSAPVPVTPENNSIGNDLSTTFIWSEGKDASTYDFQLSLNPDFNSILINQEDLTALSATVETLAHGTTYYWRVRAKNDTGASVWSAVFKYSIRSLPVPQLVNPIENFFSLAKQINFSWSVIEPIDSYTLQIAASNNFLELEAEVNDLTSTSFSSSDFMWEKKYYWRVRSVVGAHSSEWSEIRSFTPELPKTGLVAWYPFNGNANDESGNNNHGTLFTGVTSTTNRYNQPTSAFLFNGTSGYIEIPTLNEFQYKPVTYSAWVIVSSLFPLSAGHKFRSIVGRQEFANTGCGMLGFWADQNVANGTYDNTFTYWMGGAAQPDIPWSTTIPEINSWVHVVFTQSDNGDFKFYVNGELTNSGNLQNEQSANISFRIGSGIGANSYFWDNKIDDVRIYSKVLTGEEIVALYNE